MPELSRRKFVAGSSAAAAVTVAAAAGLGARSAGAAQPDTDSSTALDRPVVARVQNLSTGQVALYVGEREVVIHDKILARHLIKAASAL